MHPCGNLTLLHYY